MINGKWRRSLLDVKVRRGADVGSDHRLVVAFIRLKLKSVGQKNMGHRRYEVDKLKDLKSKRAYINNLAAQAEAAAIRNEQGTVYKITKILSGKCHFPAASLVKDKQGNLLTTEKEQELRWTEHFKETLNRPPPQEEADIPEAPSDLDIDIDPPNRELRLLAPLNP
ncbi:hypothetical protein ACROYT_G029791 [Oculina patagonica]